MRKILCRIFRRYGIAVTSGTIEKVILSHPDYPSMVCLSDSFKRWKIGHKVLNLTIGRLRELNVQGIAFLKKGEFIWVTEVSGTTVRYWSAVTGWEKMVYSEFGKLWSGVILVIDNIDEAGEQDYIKKHQRELFEIFVKYSIIICGLLCWMIVSLTVWINDASLSILHRIMLLSLNALGLFTGKILMKKERKQDNRITNMFCKAGTHVDCDKVMSSRYSKLLGVVSWAEIGMAYFITTILWITIVPLTGSDWLIPFTAFVAVALPFTLWSIAVQAAVIKKWCLFCCTIDILLWTNVFVLYSFAPVLSFALQPGSIALLMMVFTSSLGIILYNREKTVSKYVLYTERRKMLKLKYNSSVIMSLLSEQQQLVQNETGFFWGNPEAMYEVTLCVSMVCPHCDKAIQQFGCLPEYFPHLGYRLVFAKSPNEAIFHYFSDAYMQFNLKRFFQMLTAWYAEKDLNGLKQTFPVQSGNAICDLYLNTGYAPAILINGKLLSREWYNYSDLYDIARVLDDKRVYINNYFDN